MKRFLLIPLLAVLPFFSVIRAQNPGDVVSKDNVTIDLVRKIFENAYIEVTEARDTYITIKDTYTIYIDLDKDNRYLTFSVNWPINESTGLQDKFDLLNTISHDVLLITPYYTSDGTSLIIKATVWIEGGSTVKNIIQTERIFVKALNLALDKDTLKIIK